MSVNVKQCKYCGSEVHTSLMCFNRPRVPLQNKKKTINRIGKVGAKWIETRHDWIKNHPGPWRCYLCLKQLDLETLTLDHVKSRARNPELRFEVSNLEPCCWACNSRKGSMSLREYKHGRN